MPARKRRVTKRAKAKSFKEGSPGRSRRRNVLEEKSSLRHRLMIGVLVVAGLLALLATLSHTDSFEIQEVVVEGDAITPAEEILELVEGQLAGAYAGLFSRKNKILYPKDSIVAVLTDSIPRLEDVEVELEKEHTLHVVVTERAPSSLWCRERDDIEECYFIDEEGFVYAKAPHFSGDVYFLYYGNISVKDPIGRYYTEAEEFQRINNFLDLLREIDLNPVSYAIGKEGEHVVSLDAQSTSRQLSGDILFKAGDPVEQVYENLVSVLAHDTFKKTLLHQQANEEGNVPSPEHLEVEYIDLRFGNKVFFKIKE